MPTNDHIKQHSGKYTVAGIAAIYPLVFGANLLMPPEMQFSTNAQWKQSMCLTHTLLIEHYEDEVNAARKEFNATNSDFASDKVVAAERLLSEAETNKSAFC